MPIALYETLQALFASWNVVLPSKRYADSQAGNTDSWAQEVVDWMQEKCEDIIAIVKLPVATVQGALGWFFNESEEKYYVTDSKGRQYRVTPEQKAFIEGRYKTITNDGELENVSVQSLVSNMTNSITTTANPSQFGMQVSKELNALTRGIVSMEKIQTTQDWWEKVIEGGAVSDITKLVYDTANNCIKTSLPSHVVSRFPLSASNWNIGLLAQKIQESLDAHPEYVVLKSYTYTRPDGSYNPCLEIGFILGTPNTDVLVEINGSQFHVYNSLPIINIYTNQEYNTRYSFYSPPSVLPWSAGGFYRPDYPYRGTLAQETPQSSTTMTTYDYSTVDIVNRSQIDSKEAQDYATTGAIPDIVNTDDKERNLVIDPSAVDTGTWEQGAEKDATAETGANTIDKDATQTQTVTLTESITDAITNAIESIFENIGLFPEVNVDPEVAEGERAVQGLFTIWNPTEKQVAKLASYLWSSAFDDIIAQFKKWFSNPLDAIITLAYYPITPESTTTGEIKLGWFASGVTGVKKITTAKGELNCGKITIPKKYNNFLDFSPYTKVSLYLPFVGVVPLQADDVIGGSIEVIYRWEYLTGSCVAYVNVYNGLLNGKTMYQYSGNISMQIPLTGANYSNVYSGLVGGLGTAKAVLSKGGGIAGAVAGFAGSALNVKEDIQRTGSMSGNAGMLGNLTPYVIIERPLPDSPTTYNKLLGRESNSSVKIKDIKGYTECASVDLKNVRATAEEKAEIEKILLSGFYA